MFFSVISPQFLSAQNQPRLVGELTVIKNGSTATDGFVTIDGVRAASGRSIMSPAEIQTPSDASAKIVFGQTGSVTIAPNSSFSMSFVNSSIAEDLTAGEITIETVPNTTINIFTRDGAVTTPNRNQKNTIKISVQNGAARVTVSEGQAQFNQVIVSAGESFPQSTSGSAAASASSGGINPILIAGIVGAVAAVVLIALTVSSNDDNPVVSPTR